MLNYLFQKISQQSILLFSLYQRTKTFIVIQNQAARCNLFSQFYHYKFYLIQNMRPCLNIMCCDSLESSPRHDQDPFNPYELSQSKYTKSNLPLDILPNCSTNLNSNRKAKKNDKVKKSLKRKNHNPKIAIKKFQQRSFLGKQSDPYLLREMLYSNELSRPLEKKLQFYSPKNHFNLTHSTPHPFYNSQRFSMPNLRKIQSQTQRVNFIFQSPSKETIQSQETGIPELGSLKKNISIHNIYEENKKSENSSIKLKSQKSVSCHIDIKEVSIKDLANQKKSTISRNPEESLIAHQTPKQNAHLLNEEKDSRKMFLHKSAINLDEFKCVRAESIGAQSGSSDHYSEVVFRTGERNQKKSSKRVSLTGKSQGKSYSKFHMNSASDKQKIEEKLSQKNKKQERNMAHSFHA